MYVHFLQLLVCMHCRLEQQHAPVLEFGVAVVVSILLTSSVAAERHSLWDADCNMLYLVAMHAALVCCISSVLTLTFFLA